MDWKALKLRAASGSLSPMQSLTLIRVALKAKSLRDNVVLFHDAVGGLHFGVNPDRINEIDSLLRELADSV
jgi:hypothetical protein